MARLQAIHRYRGELKVRVHARIVSAIATLLGVCCSLPKAVMKIPMYAMPLISAKESLEPKGADMLAKQSVAARPY